MSEVDVVAGRVLVTGGTGSWGHELCKQLLTHADIDEIIILSRNEHKQVEMQREFDNPKLTFVIGDVRDKESLKKAMYGVDYVFHLAALKHVPVCEQNSWQSVETNIIGTHNVVMCAIDCHVKYVVDVSTDKAVEPHNIYGITKACGEKLITNAQHNYKSNTKFVCIRGGNVMGTNGSVLPLFKKQISQFNKVTVTDPNMTRFLMSTKEAINLIFEAVKIAKGGETFVMRMPAISVEQIAKTMIQKYGNKNTVIDVIGARPAEKMHEVLVSRSEIPRTYELNERYFVIIPEYGEERFSDILKSSKKTELTEFSSHNAPVLTNEVFLKQIEKEDWS
ncbi:MAG: polysaccharide biosynthesis protein [Gammaproteobacteria bacterium]|nr:polysaccharide biosynthesis protein [Gammaproteobacteria bacterium]